jgi:hypothetical protein
MRGARYTFLIVKALYELTRYEAIVWLGGSGCALRQIAKQSIAARPVIDGLERTICDAVLLATSFYWKPVLCLQRSLCTVRVLRKHGIAARLVIGYRSSPFFSHAWVEIDGRVAYGSAAYQKRLHVLHVA